MIDWSKNMQRDERGRFIKGNITAKGNKGNTKPKWSNQNAVTTGWYRRYTGLSTDKGINVLYLIIKGVSVGVLDKEHWYITKEKRIYVTSVMASFLINKYYLPERAFGKEDKGYRLFINSYQYHMIPIEAREKRQINYNHWIVTFEEHQKNVIGPKRA